VERKPQQDHPTWALALAIAPAGGHMTRLLLRFEVLVAGVVLLAGCATAMSAPDAIAARQKLMKEQGAAMRAIQDKLKAGQVQAAAADAQILADTAKRIPSLFPAGSLDPQTSRAKPEIWQKWPEFEDYAKSLESKAPQLAATARTGNAEATTAAATELGKTTCGACHQAFRGPEIKK
jgi:cytochrome c556